MPTITAQSIINAAAFTLQDEGNRQWSRAELFGYVKDAQRDLCQIKPDAWVKSQAHQLVAGPRQALPADGRALVRISCNLGTGTPAPRGRAPRQLDLAVMDMQNPQWQSALATRVVLEYGYDVREPKAFFVSPPQPATNQGQVELVYFAIPADPGGETTLLSIGDEYRTALEHYVVYRAYLKEGEFSNTAGAGAHRAEFLALLGVSERAEASAKGGA